MRQVSSQILLIVVVLVAITYAAGQISNDYPELNEYDNIEDSITREKRELENLDDEYPTASSQDTPEEPGFWDRVIKVALKLFSRFVEWLNSS